VAVSAISIRKAWCRGITACEEQPYRLDPDIYRSGTMNQTMYK
jgi:hypothetical protein